MKQPGKYDRKIGIGGYALTFVIVFGYAIFFNQYDMNAGRPKRFIQTVLYLLSKNDITFWITKSLLFCLSAFLLYKIVQLVYNRKN